MDVKQISDLLGRRNIADRVGVTPGAVTEAIRAKEFPASWYIAVRDLAAERGLDCPAALFRFKQAESAQ